MVDHYQVLGLSPQARENEIKAAFDEQLALRRSKRRSTSDLYAAFAIIGDPTMKKAYDLARFGIATSDRFNHTRAVTVEFAKDVIPDVDVLEVLAQTREVALKSLVLGSGAIASVAETVAGASRTIQSVAGRRLLKHS